MFGFLFGFSVVVVSCGGMFLLFGGGVFWGDSYFFLWENFLGGIFVFSLGGESVLYFFRSGDVFLGGVLYQEKRRS